MKLDEVLKEQYGIPAKISEAYDMLVKSLRDFPYFEQETECKAGSDSGKKYRNEIVTPPDRADHATKLCIRENLKKRKPICISFSKFSGLCDIIHESVSASGNYEEFRKFCNERGIDFYFNLFGCGDSPSNYYHFLCIGEDSPLHPNNKYYKSNELEPVEEEKQIITCCDKDGNVLFKGTWKGLEEYLSK